MTDLKRKIFFGGLIVLSLFTFMFIVTCTLIGLSVSQKCEVAQDRYEGDCAQALISYLEDEENSLRSRNSAIWALGQIGDARALPVLEKYYTGNIPDRESLDKTISQYELKKAVNLVSGGFNITKLIRENISSKK